jgi:hypothetical protein
MMRSCKLFPHVSRILTLSSIKYVWIKSGNEHKSFKLSIAYGPTIHFPIFDIYFTEFGTALTTIYLFCSSIVINTVIVTAGNFEP